MGARRSSSAPDSNGGKPRRKSGVRASSPGHCRRRHDRHEVRIQLRMAAPEGEPVSAQTANLSLGGMCIQTAAPLAPGAELRLWLELPDDGDLFMTGTVVWVGEGRAGIEQQLLGSSDTHRLSEYLASLQPRG